MLKQWMIDYLHLFVIVINMFVLMELVLHCVTHSLNKEPESTILFTKAIVAIIFSVTILLILF